jgi:hypothetical protein
MPGTPTDDPHPVVRYYPRRVRRGSAPVTLSPSQALHFATDPDRAAKAASTGEHRSYAAPPLRRPGFFRRWLDRLTG